MLCNCVFCVHRLYSRVDGEKGARKNNAHTALSWVMAPQAPRHPLLYVQPVGLSLREMMAYISSRFRAVGDYLCSFSLFVAHSSGICRALSQLPVPQQPKGKKSTCYYTPAPDVIAQKTFLFINDRKRGSGHFIWPSRRRQVMCFV